MVYILSVNTNDFNVDTATTDPLTVNETTIFRSTVVSRRISSQDGLFTVHKMEHDGGMISLEETPVFAEKTTKAIIPYQNFPELRNQLDVLGVNCATIFPDIDGLCRHLEWRYSRYPDEGE